MSIPEEAGKVATSAIGAMSGSPLALALLLVNLVFLGVGAYILGEVAENARERNKNQNELIANLVRDIRDCRQPKAGQPTAFKNILYPWEDR
jgi:hypothetical protein